MASLWEDDLALSSEDWAQIDEVEKSAKQEHVSTPADLVAGTRPPQGSLLPAGLKCSVQGAQTFGHATAHTETCGSWLAQDARSCQTAYSSGPLPTWDSERWQRVPQGNYLPSASGSGLSAAFLPRVAGSKLATAHHAQAHCSQDCNHGQPGNAELLADARQELLSQRCNQPVNALQRRRETASSSSEAGSQSRLPSQAGTAVRSAQSRISVTSLPGQYIGASSGHSIMTCGLKGAAAGIHIPIHSGVGHGICSASLQNEHADAGKASAKQHLGGPAIPTGPPTWGSAGTASFPAPPGHQETGGHSHSWPWRGSKPSSSLPARLTPAQCHQGLSARPEPVGCAANSQQSSFASQPTTGAIAVRNPEERDCKMQPPQPARQHQAPGSGDSQQTLPQQQHHHQGPGSRISQHNAQQQRYQQQGPGNSNSNFQQTAAQQWHPQLGRGSNNTQHTVAQQQARAAQPPNPDRPNPGGPNPSGPNPSRPNPSGPHPQRSAGQSGTQSQVALQTGGVPRRAMWPTLQDIKRQVELFAHLLPTLPPPPCSHLRCPGVFKHGKQTCGAPMYWYAKSREALGSSEAELVAFYCCTNPECDYREHPPKRLTTPMLTMEAVSSTTFKVEPAPGAHEAVEFCYGILALLRAVGVELSGLQNASALSAPREGEPDARDSAALFDMRHYPSVKAALLNIKRHQMVLLPRKGPIPEKTLESFRGGNRPESEEEVQRRFGLMPEPLRKALMPFQREGVLFGLERRGRVLIADEMGVGKTVQAIALASCYREEWPLLIIVPASLRLVWAEELERWLPHLRPSLVHIIFNSTDRMPSSSQAQVVITSYEMMARLTCEHCRKGGKEAAAPGSCTGPMKCMAARGFKMIIVDESHTLRTTTRKPGCHNTEAAVAALRRSRRAVLLSGTPSLSRPFDLFCQVDALRKGLLGATREDFSERYCGRRLDTVWRSGNAIKKYNNSGLTHAHELHTLLKQEVMLRRLKAEVMSQLPPKRRQVVRFDKPEKKDWPKLGRPTKAVEEDEETSGSEADGEGEEGPLNMSAAHRTGLAKLKSVIQWLTYALGSSSTADQGAASQDGSQTEQHSAGLQPGQKFLVFAHHRDVMSKLASALEGNESGWGGAPYVRIDGSTDAVDRRTAVQQFRDDPAIRVALLSVTAAGVGLDFSSASAVVFAELPEEVALVRQAEDRAHRHGQTLPVMVYFLISRGTIEERRWQRLSRNLEQVSAVHDGGRNATGTAVTGDEEGIRIDAVHEVGGRHGWSMVQQGLPPIAQGVPPFAPAPDVPGSSPAAEEGTAAGEPIAGSSRISGESLPTQVVFSATGGEEHSRADVSGCTSEPEHASQEAKRQRIEADWAVNCEQSPSRRDVVTIPDSDDSDEEAMLEETHGVGQVMQPQPVPEAALQKLKDRLQGLLTPRCQGGGSGQTQQASHDTQPGLKEASGRDGGKEVLDAGGCSGSAADAASSLPFKVCFEVSQHSGRVHFHAAEDGSQPLGLSLPLELLLMEGDPATSATLSSLLAALDSRKEGSSHVGPAGVLALSPTITKTQVEAMIAEAREFAAEWTELRAVIRNRLHGFCLRAPLAEIAEGVERKSAEQDGLGCSTSRYLEASDFFAAVPAGAEVHTISVKYVRRTKPVMYKQAFLNGLRLCKFCMAPVSFCSLSPEAVLEGAGDLFCTVDCENKFAVRSNGGSLRRQVFRLERGVCQECKLDCHRLVQSLRTIEKGSHRWVQKRRNRLVALAPAWGKGGPSSSVGKAATKLVMQLLEGNAWQADHITPVYQGGGLCDLDNLRTLCTLCHQAVTSRQRKDRDLKRQLKNQRTLDAFVKPPSAKVPAITRAPRVPRQLKRLYSSAIEGDDPQREIAAAQIRKPPTRRRVRAIPSWTSL